MPGGHEAAAERRGGLEGDGVGQAHAVEIGVDDAQILGVAAVVGHPQELQRVAQVRPAGPAVPADAAGLVERDGDPIADRDGRHLAAHLDDLAGELVTHRDRQRRREPHPRPVAHPRMPIGATDPLHLDANDRFARAGLGDSHVRDDQRLGNLDQPSSLHLLLLTSQNDCRVWTVYVLGRGRGSGGAVARTCDRRRGEKRRAIDWVTGPGATCTLDQGDRRSRGAWSQMPRKPRVSNHRPPQGAVRGPQRGFCCPGRNTARRSASKRPNQPLSEAARDVRLRHEGKRPTHLPAAAAWDVCWRPATPGSLRPTFDRRR